MTSPASHNSRDELACYDYHLPPELIASYPLPNRSDSRLLVVHRDEQSIEHRFVRELPELLSPKDCFVLNDTKVLPARLIGQRAQTGGKWEGLFLGRDEHGRWKLIGQTRGRLTVGELLDLSPPSDGSKDDKPRLKLKLVSREEDGIWLAEPESSEGWLDLLHQFGTMPLPPYMKRQVAESSDWERYQTTYAKHFGSVAAPTAGLHFTSELLNQCSRAGIQQGFVTLHVGMGTFRPISTERLSEHVMHTEWCELSPETLALVEETRNIGGRVIAVGTTSVRTLESAASVHPLSAFQGETNLFIQPGYQFRLIDGLFTNFHLPKSTLFVLVSALAGLDLIQRAYQEAIREEYRFYSYGDAMLIL